MPIPSSGRVIAIALVLIAIAVAPAQATFDVVFGTSWDGIPLQDILDAEYGPGVIDVATMYEGYHPADADPPYWEDEGVDGIIIREIAGYRNRNTMGWYEVTGGMPVIDGLSDGVVFTGPMSPGESVSVTFGRKLKFGFWLDPNGELDGRGAPQGEYFFTDRFLNDIGPSGAGTIHGPEDGDPQCLIFNITHLRDGVPTFVLAWEDLDYGLELHPFSQMDKTDNDYNDLVVEISAFSPVPTEASSWGRVKALYNE